LVSQLNLQRLQRDSKYALILLQQSLGLAQKQLHILSADASRLAALLKLGICLIFLLFRALPGRRLNTSNW